jgi:peptide/nickel transport system substrate-binding protein
MKRGLRVLAAAGSMSIALSAADAALAQKTGGILKVGHFDSPASMSMHEESTAAVNRPMMGVFNNLVIYKQDVKQNSMRSIVPELATSWAWNEEGTELTFPLRQGVRWHDGKPFTAADVKCTWDVLSGKASEKLRLNPRKSWYSNLEEVTTNGDYEVTFRLKRPQGAFLALLASGWSPVYPCHVAPRDIRNRPIGTGPFKFVEFKQNEAIRVTRNRITGSKAGASRWYRVDDHKRRFDAESRIYRRQGGRGLSRYDPAVERHQGPGVAGDLRGGQRGQRSQSDRQPRQAAL